MSALCKSLKLELHSVEQQTSKILSDLEVETKRKQEFYVELKRYISFEEPTATKYSEITQHIINFERMKKGTTTCSEENSRVRAEHNFDSESQKELLENIQSLRTRLAQTHQNKLISLKNFNPSNLSIRNYFLQYKVQCYAQCTETQQDNRNLLEEWQPTKPLPCVCLIIIVNTNCYECTLVRIVENPYESGSHILNPASL